MPSIIHTLPYENAHFLLSSRWLYQRNIELLPFHFSIEEWIFFQLARRTPCLFYVFFYWIRMIHSPFEEM